MVADGNYWFIDPEGKSYCQLLFLTVTYGAILYQASNYISSGSELLLLVPSVAGIVGSIVLPILGAVPDGMMVLFSGLGPDAQEQVSVGVGALAGSTVMLLTFPWFIAVMSGRVPLDEATGKAVYPPSGKARSFFRTGISYGEEIRKGAKIMLLTTLIYLVIQLPATAEEAATADATKQASGENTWSLVGLIVCLVGFFGYLWICYMEANDDKELNKIIDEIQNGNISIAVALAYHKKTSSKDLSEPPSKKDPAYLRLRRILTPFYHKYDVNGDGSISEGELHATLRDVGVKIDFVEAQELFRKYDTEEAGVGSLSLDEFTCCLNDYLKDPRVEQAEGCASSAIPASVRPSDDDDDDEEEVLPDEIAALSKEDQTKVVVVRACLLMGFGTFLVLIFSDPMVDVLAEWGNKLGVKPFYISFLLAPFASNASELLSAYTYAAKKSEKSITTSLSTLIGAACMNNTFCLGIFFALVYLKQLAWQFTAETIAIMLVQWIIGIIALSKKTQTTMTAIVVLLCYPFCLFMVWFLENKDYVGLD